MKESQEIENLKEIYRAKKKKILEQLDIDYLRERDYILENEVRKQFDESSIDSDRHSSDDSANLAMTASIVAMTACM